MKTLKSFFQTSHTCWKVINTHTICDKLIVFSGSSGNRGMFDFPLSGTQRNDFLNVWPICLLGDFCKFTYCALNQQIHF